MKWIQTFLVGNMLMAAAYAAPLAPVTSQSDVLGGSINYKQEFDSFYDPKFDYARFFGRVRDKDLSGQIYKVRSETKNVRFFKVGDLITFHVEGGDLDREPCRAYVRDVEKEFFVVYVEDIRTCWQRD